MEYKKNDKIELDIIDITKDGTGLAKLDGRVFFVKNAIMGDRVLVNITKITSNIIYAKAIEILSKSSYRVENLCSVSDKCGGCTLMELAYDKEIDVKSKSVINCFLKIANIDIYNSHKYLGTLSMDKPYDYRNKMQVPFGIRDGKIIYGFYAGRTHHIIEFDKCIIGFKNAEAILNAVRDTLSDYKISIYDETIGSGKFREVLLRIGNTTKEVSVTYILNDSDYKKNIDNYKRFDECVRNKVASVNGLDYRIVTSTININISNNNVLFGNVNEIIYGPGYIEDSIGDLKYHISPPSFYQINRVMTKKLYDTIVEFAEFEENDEVLDLYCGIGTISLYIARYVKNVIGVEVVDRAILDAIENAKINGITNVKFICSDATALKKDIISKSCTMIVDPPRKGLDGEVVGLIRDVSPKKIIYVSCDPATLARDVKEICESGYTLMKVLNVDMFPHTMHVETVVLMSRNRSKL